VRLLLPWIVKGVLSAAYWLACLYLAVGLMVGDRIVDGKIVAPPVPVPPLLFAAIAVGLYALLSFLWDRWQGRAMR
jgi:hypothetical protein